MNKKNMQEVIKDILDIMGDYEGSFLKINFTYNEVWFEIYENAVDIIISIKNKCCYLDCETSNNHLTKDMIEELSKIMTIIDANIDLFISCIPPEEIKSK